MEGMLNPFREQLLVDVGFQWSLSTSEEEEDINGLLIQTGLEYGRDYDRRPAVAFELSQQHTNLLPDFVIFAEWGCVILQIDEHQHKSTAQDDVHAMKSLMQALFPAQADEQKLSQLHHERSSLQGCMRPGARVHLVRYNP